MLRLLSPFAAVFLAFPAAAADFDRDVRPIFAKHCSSCHGEKNQKGGLRLDLKKDALAGGDSGPVIVPKKPGDSPLLHRITSKEESERMPPKGMGLSAAEIATLKAWIEQGAPWPDAAVAIADEHWSFKPVVRPAVPGTTKNPIDAFIRAKLGAADLKPNPEADRRTLIRRLKFDLLGLPPTPEEVEAFEKDPSADAYEKLVDRYLASPQFGERWARHWLDVVRFAESHGFEMNHERPNAWPYRDWVIQSLNDDKPYDRFVKEQIAGDSLGAEAATGFLVGGPWDQVKSPDPGLTANQRADELHDILGTTGSAFLGLTVGCARCHNHKFDPVSQVDYYRLKAVFAGVRHGERAWKNDDKKAEREKLAAELAKADAALAALEPLADPKAKTPRRMPINSRMNVDPFASVKALAVRFVILATNQGEPCLDEIEVFAGSRRIDTAGAKPRSSGDYPGAMIHKLEHIHDGKFGNSRSWISNESGRGWVELEWKQPVEFDRIQWGRDREGAFTDRTPTRYRIDVWTPGFEWITVSSSDDRAAIGSSLVSPSADQAKLQGRRAELQASLAKLERSGMVYAGTFASPEPTFRMHRGDAMQPREPVGPGTLTALGSKLDIPATATDSERRLALAKWITDANNPLTARVIVNRLWQGHFGTGLVDTPSDFGKNGGKPSHPELLDWLAAELTANKWSLKRIHKLIVTSDTYKQSSRSTPLGLEKDAQSRLLWRYPPRRLEAEAIRDSILFVSGKLDLTPGGPGFSLFEPNGNYVRVYKPKETFGPEEFRRMIYMHKTRMHGDGTFAVFDCPDGGQIAPKRNASTTPLQSLNLLNGAFLLQQAEFLAARAKPSDRPVSQVFRLAFQRLPSMAEEAAAVKLVGEHGLAALCRAVLNANEFLYVD
ncbi:MAG: PSD1 and planctomycete cytochrome C domain-containing protein [Gemmataceae bacterium]